MNSVVGRPIVLHVGAPSSQHLLASFPHATVSAPGRSWFDVVTRDLRALGCEGVPMRLAEVLSVPSIGQSEVAGAGVSCAVEGMGGVPVPAAAGRGVLAAHRHPIVVTCSPVSEEMTIFGFRVQEPPGQSLHTQCSSIMMPCRSLHSHAVTGMSRVWAGCTTPSPAASSGTIDHCVVVHPSTESLGLLEATTVQLGCVSLTIVGHRAEAAWASVLISCPLPDPKWSVPDVAAWLGRSLLEASAQVAAEDVSVCARRAFKLLTESSHFQVNPTRAALLYPHTTIPG